MKLTSVRSTNFIAFLVCCGLLATAGYLQISQGLEPCPLCVIQRVIIIALAVLFLIGSVYAPRTLAARLYNFVIFLVSATGILFAGRQVWLQHLPAGQVPACGPGLDYMLDRFPLNETMRLVFHGSGECAEVHWRFLSLSIPEWTLVFFVLFSVLALVNIRRL